MDVIRVVLSGCRFIVKKKMNLFQRKIAFLLFTAIATICISTVEYKTNGLLRHFKGFFQSTFKWYRNNGVTQSVQRKTTIDLTRENGKEFDEKPTELDGSLVPGVSPPFGLLRNQSEMQENRQGACTCDVPVAAVGRSCTTTCTSTEIRCGQTCIVTTVFTASYIRQVYSMVLVKQSLTSYNAGCPGLPCVTLTTTTTTTVTTSTLVYVTTTATSVQPLISFSTVAVVPVAPVVIGAVAAFAAGVGLCIGAVEPSTVNLEDNNLADIEPVTIIGQETPVNNLEIPVQRTNFTDDGCGSNSVRFENGNCATLLRRGPCASPYQWVTLDPISLKGRCTPRLCGRRRVFVGRDGLCHDINDPNECQGGRRLYYSAFGDSLCDCPIGQYPFPGEGGNCVALFTQGPCTAGSVVNINEANGLVCTPSQCPGNLPFQIVPLENGQCFALGTRGTCPATHLLGYNVFERNAVCVNMEDPSSPYFSSPEEDEIIDRFYNQNNPIFNDVQVVFQQNALKRNDTANRRQGVFQFPNRFPDSLLNPCRPGDRYSFNDKCANPIVPNYGISDTQPPVQSPYRCQSNDFLQVTGQCSNNNRGASCGSSHRYNPSTGQCRPIFR